MTLNGDTTPFETYFVLFDGAVLFGGESAVLPVVRLQSDEYFRHCLFSRY